MTIGVSVPEIIYNASGLGPYAIPFAFKNKSTIKVEVQNSLGIWNDVTTFVVSGTSLTFSSLVDPVKIRIYRQNDINQNQGLKDFEDFPAQLIEAALDKITEIAQENNRDLARSIKLPLGSDHGQLNTSFEGKLIAIEGGQPVPAEKSGITTLDVNNALGYIQGGDAGWTLGGITGTDFTTTIQARSDEIEASGGGTLNFTQGNFRVTSLSKSKGTNWTGEGTAHHAYWAANTSRKGTVLVGQAPNSGYVLAFEEAIEGGVGVSNMSIYNANASATGIVKVGGILHWQLENVEIGYLGNTPSGIGLHVAKTAGISLYGSARHLSVINCAIALQIEYDCNANTFDGCAFQGSQYSLKMIGNATYQPYGITFNGCAFEGVYSAGVPEIVYLAAGSAARKKLKNYGDNNSGVYILKFVKITHAKQLIFNGCYFEYGSYPATFNDGTNGVANLVPVIALEGAYCQNVELNNCSMVAYLYDDAVGTICNPLQDGVQYTARKVPWASYRKSSSSQSIAVTTWTTLDFAAQKYGDEGNAFAWNSTTKKIDILHAGMYQINSSAYCEALAQCDYFQTRIIAGGITYETNTPQKSASATPTSSKQNITVNLAVGDTIQVDIFHSAGASQTVQAYPTQTWLNVSKIGGG